MRPGLAVAAAVVALAGCSSEVVDTSAGTEVAEALDGDTIETTDGERVRLVQIDAPELGDDECYSHDAAAELADLLPPGTAIRLEADPRLDDTDRFDRLLRYVHRDGMNVNLELVRRGAASPYFFDDDRGRYADELLDAARDAEEAGRGLWGACPSTRLEPWHAVDTGPGGR